MNKIRVCVDGLVREGKRNDGSIMTVDSRQYLVCTPSGQLILETPDVDKVLGQYKDYETKDYENDRYSPEKVELINQGLQQIRLRMTLERD